MNRSEFEKSLDKLVGGKGVLFYTLEKKRVYPVSFVGYETDQQGCSAMLESIVMPGFYPTTSKLTFDASWDQLTVSPRALYGHREWLLLEPEAITDFYNLVAHIPEGETYLDDWHVMGNHHAKSSSGPASKFTQRNAPGPVYRAVYQLEQELYFEHLRKTEKVSD